MWYNYFDGNKSRGLISPLFFIRIDANPFFEIYRKIAQNGFQVQYPTPRLLWLVSVAAPLSSPLTISIHAARYIPTVHLNPSAGSVSRNRSFYRAGISKINILRPAAFAQRTRKARLLLTCGAIHLVPPPASCGEERHIPGLTGYLAVSVQVVRLPGAQFWSDGLILRRFTLRQT